MKTIDEKDKKILNFLQAHGDATAKQIGKALHMPITTVHHRIKRLKTLGIIKRFTVDIHWQQLGYDVSAYILVEVNYDQLQEEKISQHELIDRLKKYEEIIEASVVTGETDIVIKVRTETIEQLDNFIIRILRNIKGISKTKTLVVLHE